MSIEILGTKLDALQSELVQQRETLNRVSESLSLLARVEERQTNTNASLDRAFVAMDKLTERISAVENKLPAFSQTAVWVERAVIALVAIVGTYVAKQTGLIP